MTKTEGDLLQLLLTLEETVRARATMHPKPDLMPILERLDRAAEDLPKGTDPRLLHYLRNKSYEKARLWLQGRESDNQAGACG